MTTLRFYNTLTRRVEPFVPLDPEGQTVTFYACGPTVYDFAHIGNFRSFLAGDILRRTLELLGYEVRQVMNLTDVGHMTDDQAADGEGEDKMEVAARRLREAKKAGTLPEGSDVDPSDPYAIADFYADAFIADAERLGLKVVEDAKRHPELMPRATQYMTPMIALTEKLLERGHAYLGDDGAVYYDVQSFPDYGQLSGNTLESLRSGAGGRVEETTQRIKRHPADFMLWKPDPRHLMKWKSPWGEGYPGWHLECSVMAMDVLGSETHGVIDIHSGGEDLIFPHHECEIAQACGASGESKFARYWFHTRFLIVEGKKMSKSAGNFFTLRDVLAKGASPAAIRLELIKTHYRSQANFTLQGLRDSQRQVERWARLRDWLEQHQNEPMPFASPGPLTSALKMFEENLCDDLNVAAAIGALNESVNHYQQHDKAGASGNGSGETYAGELLALQQMDHVLGVLDLERDAVDEAVGVDADEIEQLIQQRNEARRNKDFAEADRIRDELRDRGIELHDGPQGTTWEKLVQ